MNKEILKPEVQAFINEHINDDINKILLGKSPFPNLSTKDLAQQIDSKKRCEKKLALWFSTPGIFFPPKLNIEQTSSGLTAEYKSNLIKGKKLVDLTGGFGVDAYYFSGKAEEVIHIEQNKELSDIASHNASVFGTYNIRFINADSIQFIKETNQTFDTIYIDPARRIQSKKVFLLKDTEPDVVSHLDRLLNKASRIIIKTSPLFDIQSGLKELKHVSEVHVVSVKNDCKELLWVIDKDFNEEPEIFCVTLNGSTKRIFKFQFSQERSLELKSFSDPLSYIYEPDVALLKAGCFKSVSQVYHLLKLHTNTHLYTSEIVNNDFIGKIFKVRTFSAYKDFSKSNSIKKANVISRNFPQSPDELKKKHKLQDGGETYLLFCIGANNQLIVIEAERF